MPTILHIIEQLSGAGPTRALLSVANYHGKLGRGGSHRAVVLRRPIYPIAQLRAKHAGLELIVEPDQQAFQDEMSRADIIHLHFWNTPTLYAWLRQEKPAMRLLLNAHVFGKYPPQVLTDQLLSYADHCVLASSESLHLDAVSAYKQKVQAIFCVPDLDRISGLQRQPHDFFNIGYIGTLNFNKLHPDFVPMNAAVNIPNKQFIWCGNSDGSLISEIEAAGLTDDVRLPGYVENLRSVLEIMDVFGYPLRSDTYAASEISLQNAMLSGIPPVVFPAGGIPALVAHEETGLVVHSADEYARAIERLYADPDLRQRLGEQAQAFIKDNFSSDRMARQFDQVYERLMAEPKRRHAWPGDTASTPALYFIEALGNCADPFIASMNGDDAGEQAAADEHIANASTLLAYGEGGIVQYRNSFADDPYLGYWTALVLLRQGRFETALVELKRAAGKLDIAGRPYLQRYPDIVKALT